MSALDAWLRWFDLLRTWHRHEVHGLDHLRSDRAMLLVGYHGRPIAHDLCMLQNVVYRELGYMPHPIFHEYFGKNPRLKAVIDELGFVTGDGDDLRAAVERGEHVIVTPGGTREGCRSALYRHRVDWGGRTGYLRLAHKYNLPVVPVASRGTDWAYIGLNNGYRLSRKLRVPHGIPLWFGLGLVGVWPVAIPLPVKIRTYIGAPMEMTPVDPGDRRSLLQQHTRVVARVQGLLDRGLPPD